MDLLNKENGTTIIESLVVILLLGIIVTITALFFNNLLNNYNMLRTDALHLARQEMNKALSQFTETDTTYLNSAGNLEVRRIVTNNDDHYGLQVIVVRSRTDITIITLNAIYSK